MGAVDLTPPQNYKILVIEDPDAVRFTGRSGQEARALPGIYLGPIKSKIIKQRSTGSPLDDLLTRYPRTAHPHNLARSHVVMRSHLDEGRTYSGFRATVGETTVVSKFATPSIGPFSETAKEAYIFHHYLKALQGSVVPEWHGVWVSLGRAKETYLAVLQDGGEPMTPNELRCLPITDKNVIYHKYRALHAAGVIHGSPYYKHWVKKSPIDQLRIIDFGRATHRDEVSTESFTTSANREIRQVCKAIALDPSHRAPWPLEKAAISVPVLSCPLPTLSQTAPQVSNAGQVEQIIPKASCPVVVSVTLASSGLPRGAPAAPPPAPVGQVSLSPLPAPAPPSTQQCTSTRCCQTTISDIKPADLLAFRQFGNCPVVPIKLVLETPRVKTARPQDDPSFVPRKSARLQAIRK